MAHHGPSCKDRFLMGLGMGATVGVCLGALFGSFSAFRYGLRGREFFSTVGQSMLQMGGTFGFIMSVGSGLRCEDGSDMTPVSAAPMLSPLIAAPRPHSLKDRLINSNSKF